MEPSGNSLASPGTPCLYALTIAGFATMTLIRVSVALTATSCHVSYPLNSKNASLVNTFSVYLSCAASATAPTATRFASGFRTTTSVHGRLHATFVDPLVSIAMRAVAARRSVGARLRPSLPESDLDTTCYDRLGRAVPRLTGFTPDKPDGTRGRGSARQHRQAAAPAPALARK